MAAINITSRNIMATKKKNGVALDFAASTRNSAEMSAFMTHRVEVPTVWPWALTLGRDNLAHVGQITVPSEIAKQPVKPIRSQISHSPAWLRGLAKAGNQRPIGQGHFVEDVFPPFNGGARRVLRGSTLY